MAKGSISDAIARSLGDVSSVDTSVRGIPLNHLKPNSMNFYPAPTQEAMNELIASIAANGLLEPLTVTPDGNKYRIISGHSRWRALQSLEVRNARPELLEAVPCVVLPEMSKAQEVTFVIEANRQRVKGGSTLAMEAEKLTQAYIDRQRAGEQLPGRIRDRVAKALAVSASKLAMAEATRRNLTLPGFQAQWKDGRIGDTVAYEISKMGSEHQYRLLDWLCDNHRETGSLTVKEVAELEQQFSKRSREWDMPKEKEDALFIAATERVLAKHLRVYDLVDCTTRTEAIKALKKCNNYSSGGGDAWSCMCNTNGVTVRDGKSGCAPNITRNWAEVYDALCLVALRKQMQEE